MVIAALPVKFVALIHRRRAMRPTRFLQDWIALTIARLMTFTVVGGLVCVAYIVEMTTYDDFRKCDKNSTITRLEWVLGFRPAEDCRSY